MTTEQQIKALAELDGWRFESAPYDSEVCWRKNGLLANTVSNYLTSYDAIVPLIQKQPHDVGARIDMTPSQICEALLRATGRWIE